MRKLVIFLFCLLLLGCGATSQNTTVPASSVSGEANLFNPYMRQNLPNTRKMTDEGRQMLGAMGAGMQSIEGEAAHRKNWREEIYPVVYGEKTAPNEILVILNFSSPDSESAWNSVREASKSLSPQQTKIVVFDRSSENYGTDLMGLAIWIAHSRPGQAMAFLDYALNRWNQVKAGQRSGGTAKKFTNEYDATLTARDLPIHYAYFSRLNPPIPDSQQPEVSKYCYNAGKVNMYQANQICEYFGIGKLPAVLVNGRQISSISSGSILSALN